MSFQTLVDGCVGLPALEATAGERSVILSNTPSLTETGSLPPGSTGCSQIFQFKGSAQHGSGDDLPRTTIQLEKSRCTIYAGSLLHDDQGTAIDNGI